MAAKTGKINHYKNYPAVAKRIGKATGGKNGRMPAWFQYSKNARADTPENKKRKYAKPNNSTMNRICKAFDDIGNINLNYAGVQQFNYQMLLSEQCKDFDPEVVELFCTLDNSNIAVAIEVRDVSYSNEKILINDYGILADDITQKIIEKYGSLEYAYPYIATYLFAGEGVNKPAHKRMFWRVFGQIALDNLRKNLSNCDTCEECNMKIPAWVENHICIKNTKGFYECVVCHTLCERTNSRQCRCDYCQEKYERLQRTLRQKNNRRAKKEAKSECITRLQLSSNET